MHRRKSARREHSRFSSFEVKHMAQRDENSCAIACVAMIGCGLIDYEEVEHLAYVKGWLSEIRDEGCTWRRLRALLGGLGVPTMPVRAVSKWHQVASGLAIVFVKRRKRDVYHAVVCERLQQCPDEVRVYDPSYSNHQGIRVDYRRLAPDSYIDCLAPWHDNGRQARRNRK